MPNRTKPYSDEFDAYREGAKETKKWSKGYNKLLASHERLLKALEDMNRLAWKHGLTTANPEIAWAEEAIQLAQKVRTG